MAQLQADGIGNSVQNTEDQHQKDRHPRGGQAKYLEDAARDAGVRERMLRALAEGVRAEWRTK